MTTMNPHNLIGFSITLITWTTMVSVSSHSLSHHNPSDFLLSSSSPATEYNKTDTPVLSTMADLSEVVQRTNNSLEHNTSLFISPLASNHSNAFLGSSSAPSSTSKLIVQNLTSSTIELKSERMKEDEIDEFRDEAVRRYFEDIHNYIFPNFWKWVMIACHIIVFVVGLLGNVLVCVAVYRNYGMRTVTNYFIVNLAVADFLVILFCLPPTLIWDVTSTWFFGDIMCKTVLYIQTVSVTVSVLTLTFISIDRWYAICYPIRFKSTTRRAQTAIFFIWFVSLVLDIQEIIGNKTDSFTHDLQIDSVFFTQCVSKWSVNVERNITISRIILLYFLPLILMSVFYTQIIRVLWQSETTTTTTNNDTAETRQFNFSMVSNSSIKRQLRSRKKAAKMLVIVVGMFAFCFLPVHLFSLMRLVVKLSNSQFNNAIAMISHWLCYANSAMNPIIYNFMSGKFRKEFKRAVKCSRNDPDFRFELNVIKTQLRKLNSSLARSDTNRTTMTSTT